MKMTRGIYDDGGAPFMEFFRMGLFLVVTAMLAEAATENIHDDLMEPYSFDFSKTKVWNGISYGNDWKYVEQGDRLEIADVQLAPKVKFPTVLAGNGLCTMMMVDPDAPSRLEPRFRSWLHWMVVNLPCDCGQMDFSQGDLIAKYIPSAPPEGSGPHRYIFFAFKQSGFVRAEPINDRKSFSPERIAKRYGLGDPTHANYFVAEQTTSTPISADVATFNQLGGSINEDLMEPYKFNFAKTVEWNDISYGGRTLQHGGMMLLQTVQSVPKVKFSSVLAGNKLCTLMMVDPDAPNRQRPVFRSHLHWLVVNLPCKQGEVDVNQGSVLAEYAPPNPSSGSGPHRYIFFAFRQKEAVGTRKQLRRSFNAELFARDHGLENPTHATYFITERPSLSPRSIATAGKSGPKKQDLVEPSQSSAAIKPSGTVDSDLMEPYNFDFSKTLVWNGISYGSKVVQHGQSLEVTDFRTMPRVTFPSTLDGNGLCTLMMVDPDSLTRENPRYRSWLSWLVVDLPCEQGEVSINTGKVLSTYRAPILTRASGPHRNVFFVFRQSGNVGARPIRSKYRFSAEGFARTNGLGDPTHTTYFIGAKQ